MSLFGLSGPRESKQPKRIDECGPSGRGRNALRELMFACRGPRHVSQVKAKRAWAERMAPKHVRKQRRGRVKINRQHNDNTPPPKGFPFKVLRTRPRGPPCPSVRQTTLGVGMAEKWVQRTIPARIYDVGCVVGGGALRNATWPAACLRFEEGILGKRLSGGMLAADGPRWSAVRCNGVSSAALLQQLQRWHSKWAMKTRP